jgi:hypothetical protein
MTVDCITWRSLLGIANAATACNRAGNRLACQHFHSFPQTMAGRLDKWRKIDTVSPKCVMLKIAGIEKIRFVSLHGCIWSKGATCSFPEIAQNYR